MPVTVAQIKKAITDEPDIAAVYVTSPSYEGICCDYRAIKDLIGERYLIVDEAHGAHHYFSSLMPVSALNGGADVALNSLYKTLGSMSSIALI